MPCGDGYEFDCQKMPENHVWDYGDLKEFMGRMYDALGAGPAASESMEILLTGTLRRLPQEVYLFVRENCRFIEVSPNGGQALIVRRNCEHKRLILLASQADDSTIARDIAHAWLGHQCPPSTDMMENIVLQEVAAWMAVKEWGWDVQAKIDYNRKLLHEYRLCTISILPVYHISGGISMSHGQVG